MATITKGILGGFSGKVGTIVGSNFRGKDIIRSVPKPSSKPATDKQLLQQAKFKLVISFMQPLKAIQTRFFGQNSGVKSRINLAVSYLLDNAVDVVLDVPQFIYNKILITKGDRAGFQNLTTALGVGQQITFTWEDNSAQGNADALDSASVVFYCEELGSFEIYEGVATRLDLSADITLPAFYLGKAVHVWLYFNDVAEKQACNSNYQGLLTIL